MKKSKSAKGKKKGGGVILLKDLAPRKGVKGGAGKILFGERVEGVEGDDLLSDVKRDDQKK